MMNTRRLDTAIFEAKRFVEVAQAARKRLKTEPGVSMGGCRETAACRRLSLELTHALADLRNPKKS